jgi:hypothetical protein
METTDDRTTYFYIQSLAVGADRRLRLLSPQRIPVQGQAEARDCEDFAARSPR